MFRDSIVFVLVSYLASLFLVPSSSGIRVSHVGRRRLDALLHDTLRERTVILGGGGEQFHCHFNATNKQNLVRIVIYVFEKKKTVRTPTGSPFSNTIM
jgi:hypothetical protein